MGRIWVTFLLLGLICFSADGQLRIVDYNTAGGPRAGLDVVLEAIGNETVPGFARPIDVLSLQEQSSATTTTQAIVDMLNGIYGAGTYTRGSLNGQTSGAGRPGLIYNSTTVSLIEEIAFGNVNTSAQARQTLRYQLRPVGYDASADFYVYSNHYKASTGSSNQARRQIEAAALRADADALGQGTHAIYTGDFNIRSSNEASYQTLLAPGNGQAFDPINAPGTWHDASAFKTIHTQAPAVSPPGLVGGGVDDRFDFQLVTGEFQDDEGLSYLPGSYHTFGNNGTHGISGHISSGNGAAGNVLSALETASDHLPIVADYQLPGILDAALTNVPATVPLGSTHDIVVSVENAANVVASIGADELEYTVNLSGDTLGTAADVVLALAGTNSHLFTLDTSTAGARSVTVTVETLSQGAANSLITLPFSYEVVGNIDIDFEGDGDFDCHDLDLLLAAGPINSGVAVTPGTNDHFDLNADGIIDLDDLDQWLADAANLNGLGNPYLRGDANLDGGVDASDFNLWNANKFHVTTRWCEGNFDGDDAITTSDFNLWNANKFTSSTVLVPEPAMMSMWFVLCGAALLVMRRHKSPPPRSGGRSDAVAAGRGPSQQMWKI